MRKNWIYLLNLSMKNKLLFEFYGFIKTITLICFIVSIVFVSIFIGGIIVFLIETKFLNFEIGIIVEYAYSILISKLYLTIPLLLGSIVFIYFFIIKKTPPP